MIVSGSDLLASEHIVGQSTTTQILLCFCHGTPAHEALDNPSPSRRLCLHRRYARKRVNVRGPTRPTICAHVRPPALLSRQFLPLPKTRIEALLTAFPKLVPPPNSSSQHTSVETSDVRYVYQPIDDLVLLLVTNKASNILQDIDTLHLFARVVADVCGGRALTDRDIADRAFELLGAFDEVVGLGYREPVGLPQIRGILEMESHEEKIQ